MNYINDLNCYVVLRPESWTEVSPFPVTWRKINKQPPPHINHSLLLPFKKKKKKEKEKRK